MRYSEPVGVATNYYQSKYNKLSGSSYREVEAQVRKLYYELSKKTKRKPYIRSKYFSNNKIFLDYYWAHLNQKSRRERLRRLPYYKCGLDLLINTKLSPEVKTGSQSMFRFYGKTADNKPLCVQVKQSNRNQKHLISIFPYK